MATKYYVGTTGDWDSDNSWSTTRGGAGGAGEPEADDIAIVENLNHAMNTNISQGSVDLQGLFISIAPGGSLGSAGNPLDIDVSNVSTGTPQTRIINNGGAPVYLTGNHDLLKIISPAEVILSGSSTNGNVYLGRNGLLRVKDGVAITTLQSTGSGVIIEPGTGAVAAVNMVAGSATTERNITTVNLYGSGRLRAMGSAAFTTVSVFPNAVFTHNSSGTIGTIYVLTDGKASAAGSPYQFTVTNSTVYAGGLLFEDVPAGFITYTNPTASIP